MTNELKPCPFCGEAGKLQTREDGGGEILVTCQSCESSAWVDKWNTRTSEPVVKPCTDAVEALENACAKYLFGRSAAREIRNDSKIMASMLGKNIAAQGYTITRAAAPSGELAEAWAKVRLNRVPVSGDAASEQLAADNIIEAAFSNMEALQREVERKDAALEVGIAYIAAAQAGLSFTQLRMKADMSLLEDALKGKAQQSAVCGEGSTTTVDDWRKASDWISDSRLGKAPPAKPKMSEAELEQEADKIAHASYYNIGEYVRRIDIVKLARKYAGEDV